MHKFFLEDEKEKNRNGKKERKKERKKETQETREKKERNSFGAFFLDNKLEITSHLITADIHKFFKI